ncbi:molybdopterin synthase catalytic subunit [Sporothrix schenckii 1099-18]|uniref:Molybdopterin synthase catalytic subunit n=1 Tax=Sporothrix schenckii 1099-18 TaxID=1397361 RepID=A0A0F2LZ03_SPOSC|nr:molybdopterin synthase catalytic subunit [Sporothrix schenckii 1099-18]KJR82697.1 molybdopterin synthase catalytic subunit [Sporothrix schenckii 1099-18]
MAQEAGVQDVFSGADALAADGCFVALSDAPLDVVSVLQRVRSPKAGANVLFAGIIASPLVVLTALPRLAPRSTRDSFGDRAVATLRYASYRPRALRTMLSIARDVYAAHDLIGIAVVHRLGPVPIGEDSILIAVSAAHRRAAWRAGEACLELAKERLEVWKEEVFAAEQEGQGGNTGQGPAEGESVWRANRDPTSAAPTIAKSASTNA